MTTDELNKLTPSPETMKLANDLYVKCVKPEIDTLLNKLATANKQIFLLIKKLQEAKRDSERLDWLAERQTQNPLKIVNLRDYTIEVEGVVIGKGDNFRDALDIAREKEGQGL